MPRDALTRHIHQSGPTTTREILATTTDGYTVLDIGMIQSNVSSDTYFKCGDGQTILHNFATNISSQAMNFQCHGRIYMDKTGNDDISATISYVPRIRQVVPDPPLWFATTTEQYASTTQQTAQSFIANYGQFVLILCGTFIVIAILKAIYDLFSAGGSMKV